VDDLRSSGLDSYYLFHAARADLLGRLGRDEEAAAAYDIARSLTANPVEQAFLDAQRAAVTARYADAARAADDHRFGAKGAGQG
jgi:predicted RNA polymerase sigma factor